MIRRPPRSTRTDTLFPYTTLFRSCSWRDHIQSVTVDHIKQLPDLIGFRVLAARLEVQIARHIRVLENMVTAAGQLEFDSEGFGDPAPFLKTGATIQANPGVRSEERRVGQECVSTCRTWGGANN